MYKWNGCDESNELNNSIERNDCITVWNVNSVNERTEWMDVPNVISVIMLSLRCSFPKTDP